MDVFQDNILNSFGYVISEDVILYINSLFFIVKVAIKIYIIYLIIKALNIYISTNRKKDT